MTGESPVVVAEARDAIEASIWLDALTEAGISASVFERGVGAALGGAVTPGFSVFLVLVERSSLGAARSVIADIAGAAVLARFRDDETATRGQRRALLTAVGVLLGVLVLGALAKLAAV
jgi:hypothetical protein